MRTNCLYVFLILVSLLATSCRQQATSSQASSSDSLTNSVSGDSKAYIQVLGETEHNFGTFKKPDILEHYFVYKNIGNTPFIIYKVEPSCHCVSIEYNDRPLAPGAVDSIKMTYDGNGYQPGYFNKSCHVLANNDSVYTFRIKGYCIGLPKRK